MAGGTFYIRDGSLLPSAPVDTRACSAVNGGGGGGAVHRGCCTHPFALPKCHFPIMPVRYPAGRRYSAMVVSPNGNPPSDDGLRETHPTVCARDAYPMACASSNGVCVRMYGDVLGAAANYTSVLFQHTLQRATVRWLHHKRSAHRHRCSHHGTGTPTTTATNTLS